VKKAGDILSAFFDEKMMQQAQGYSKLFSSWIWLTKKYGIAAAADHSRIRELERNILQVEADHPGWIQILQTKEHKLLEDLQVQFPDLDLRGISFRLSREPPLGGEKNPDGGPETAVFEAADPGPLPEEAPEEEKKSGYDNIKNEKLRESLKSLEKHIAARNSRRK
jgi:hypothetical protein